MLTLGIDVGGTKIAAGVVDEAGAVIARRTISTEAADPRAITAGIAKVGQELHAAAPAIAAAGVGAAGIIDVQRGVVLSAPNLAWKNVALRSMLEDRLGMAVIVDNDANVAALGEALYGAGKGIDDQVMVTVGTGIGGGLVLGGHLYRGPRGLGAEVGHMILAGADGPRCGCGNRGCFEVMASGTSMGRRARDRAAADPAAATVLAMAGGEADLITGEMVGAAARDGDPFAVAIVQETGHWLGLGLASVVNLLDPALIVVGGGASRDGDLLLEPARRALADHILGHPDRTPPPVVEALLGTDAGVVGAAALAREVA